MAEVEPANSHVLTEVHEEDIDNAVRPRRFRIGTDPELCVSDVEEPEPGALVT